MKCVEMHYTVAEVSLLVRLCPKTVIVKLKAGEFGPDVVDLGTPPARSDYRIPASGVNAWLSARRVFSELGIAVRSTGELRRKAAAAATEHPPEGVLAS